MLQNVIADIPGSDLFQFSLLFETIHHPGGHDDAVLNEFLRVFSAYTPNGVGNRAMEAGTDFIFEKPTCLGGHFDFLS
jgi:hypothetical protein